MMWPWILELAHNLSKPLILPCLPLLPSEHKKYYIYLYFLLSPSTKEERKWKPAGCIECVARLFHWLWAGNIQIIALNTSLSIFLICSKAYYFKYIWISICLQCKIRLSSCCCCCQKWTLTKFYVFSSSWWAQPDIMQLEALLPIVESLLVGWWSSLLGKLVWSCPWTLKRLMQRTRSRMEILCSICLEEGEREHFLLSFQSSINTSFNQLLNSEHTSQRLGVSKFLVVCTAMNLAVLSNCWSGIASGEGLLSTTCDGLEHMVCRLTLWLWPTAL